MPAPHGEQRRSLKYSKRNEPDGVRCRRFFVAEGSLIFVQTQKHPLNLHNYGDVLCELGNLQVHAQRFTMHCLDSSTLPWKDRRNRRSM